LLLHLIYINFENYFDISQSYDTITTKLKLTVFHALEDDMSTESFMCKIGIHNGEPVKANAQDRDKEKYKNIEEIKKQKVKCIRCGKVYREMVGIDPTFFGYP
jgi:hypothetical protein